MGLGYIGLPTSVILASAGMNVYGYDVREEHLNNIRQGRTGITEKGFSEKLKEVLDKGLLTLGNTLDGGSDVYLIVVSTSLDKEKNEMDIRALTEASYDVGRVIKRGDLVIVESTVCVGTTEGIIKPILEKTSGLSCRKDFYLAFCPERVLPGDLIRELISNDRIIGGVDRTSSELAKGFYEKFVQGKIYLTDARTAEMAKLIENTYRAVNIALANELALIAEHTGVDVHEAIRLANTHPRVHVHNPGPGVGGYCLTKDPWFLIQNFKGSRIIRDAMRINAEMPDHVIAITERGLKRLGKMLSTSRVCVLGLAYKGNISDPRESPGYEIYLRLKMMGADAVIHDPLVNEYMGYSPVKDVYEAVKGCDAVILATEHDCYLTLDWERIKKLMNPDPLVIDTKNMIRQPPGFYVKKLGAG